MTIDPVCGRPVDPDHSRFFSEYANETHHFCSPECKRAFDDHPDRVLQERRKADARP